MYFVAPLPLCQCQFYYLLLWCCCFLSLFHHFTRILPFQPNRMAGKSFAYFFFFFSNFFHFLLSRIVYSKPTINIRLEIYNTWFHLGNFCTSLPKNRMSIASPMLAILPFIVDFGQSNVLTPHS